jgi:putative tryptophan/tyrosine transport system substrate-binding protein
MATEVLMRRIGLAVVLAGSFVLTALAPDAQQAASVYQIGLLTLGSDPTRSEFWQKFLQAMHELNYVEGRNLIVRRAFADGKADRLPGLVADLVQAKVDVIVTTSTQETAAAKRASSTIPIVMTVAPDPVEQGLVASLAQPGGNVTGLTSMAPGASQKFVELLRETVPSASRFAVLATGPNAPPREIRHELQTAARQVGVTLSFIEIKSADDLDPTLARAKKDGAGGIIAPLGAFTYAHRAKLVHLALKHRLPGIYWVRDYVEAGGLMSYGANPGDVGRRAAYFVDRILKGARPADLPVEQPTNFELVINLKTAKALGLTIPQSVLVRADELIQ